MYIIAHATRERTILSLTTFSVYRIRDMWCKKFITFGLVGIGRLDRAVLEQYIGRGQIAVDDVLGMQPGYERAQPTSYEFQQVIHVRLSRNVPIYEVLQHRGVLDVLHVNATPVQVHQVQSRCRYPLKAKCNELYNLKSSRRDSTFRSIDQGKGEKQLKVSEETFVLSTFEVFTFRLLFTLITTICRTFDRKFSRQLRFSHNQRR